MLRQPTARYRDEGRGRTAQPRDRERTTNIRVKVWTPLLPKALTHKLYRGMLYIQNNYSTLYVVNPWNDPQPDTNINCNHVTVRTNATGDVQAVRVQKGRQND